MRVLATALALTLAASCAFDWGSLDPREGGAPGGGGAAAQGGEASSGGSGGNISTTGTGGAGGTCQDQVVAATPLPATLSVMLMLDRSGSMNSGGKWADAQTAVTGFLSATSSEDVVVALNFFKAETGGACDLTSYNPPHLGPGLLATEASGMVATIMATMAADQTPTSAVLEGSLAVAGTLSSNPDDVVVAVLITDGDPNDCVMDIPTIAGLAADGLTNGVPTYVIAVDGAVLADMSTISMAGGTGPAIDVAMDTLAIEQELATIRDQRRPCVYELPQGLDGPLEAQLTIDGDTESLAIVDDAAACSGNDEAYVDDPTAPTKLWLCPGACADAASEGGAVVDVTLACP